MVSTLCGLILLAYAPTYAVLLLAAAFVGLGSAIFHPESSRVARMASGGRHGLAQSIFQVGGNAGTATGPLLAAWIVLPHGQKNVAWFSLAALLAIVVLIGVGRWYSHQHPNKDLSGRGELQGLSVRHGRHWKGGLIAGYTIRVLVGFGYLSPINKANAAPFSAGGPPHRDYHLDPRNHRPRGPK